MSYLFFEMSAWLLAVFIVGLLLGAWIGYACRSSSEAEELGTGDSVGDDQKAAVDNSDDIAHDVASEGSDVNEDDLGKAIDDSGAGESKNEEPANLISEEGLDTDDLKKLKGVGPKLEKLLNELGVYNFKQIADWQKKDVDWVNAKLSFSGRIEREDWISQARTLAEDGATDTV
jgi:predicted flap endonuclease-1-like 5' DNA nuclease